MVKVTINGQTAVTATGMTIVEVAKQLGIYIPTLCYHEKLTKIASCRICLVEIVGNSRLVTACNTLVTDNMQIITNSAKVLAARRAMLELLLLNHPLDCPTCDKAGACKLQDLVMEYGNDFSLYFEGKRVVASNNGSPVIAKAMNRCIHCFRCVRFTREVAGSDEFAVVNSGAAITIMPVPGVTNSGLLGNVIDLCPVGAFLAKPGAGIARNWEVTSTDGISPHDCLGSNLQLYTANDQVVRVAARENATINECWLSDRERFSYEALQHNERISQPLIKQQGKWLVASWDEALSLVNHKFKQIVNQYGANELGGLISASATLEEQYVVQKYLRQLGTNNIDHRLWQVDFTGQELAPVYPSLGIAINELEEQQVILIIGANILQEQPLLGLKLRKMALTGSKLGVINPIDFTFNFPVTTKNIVACGDLVTPLLAVVKILLAKFKTKVPPALVALIAKVDPTAEHKAIANMLQTSSEKKLLILGEFAISHPQAFLINALSELIAHMLTARCGTLTKGANTAGAWFAGCVPHRGPGGQAVTTTGKNAKEMLTTPLKAYLLFGCEELDMLLAKQAITTLQQAELVVACSCFASATLLDLAEVLLPIASFAETTGTFINVAGTWQTFTQAIKPYKMSLPGWQVITQLGAMLAMDAFIYPTRANITKELTKLEAKVNDLASKTKPYDFLQYSFIVKQPSLPSLPINKLTWIADVPIFHTDALLRRANALQQLAKQEPQVAKINPQVAVALQVKNYDLLILQAENGTCITLPVYITASIPLGSIYIANGIKETFMLGCPYTTLKITVKGKI